MEQKKIYELQKVIDKVLKATKRFHEVFGKVYNSGFIGELLVMQRILKIYEKALLKGAELEFKGNHYKGYDIAFTLNSRTFKINAKATTKHLKNDKPEWVRQHAKTYMKLVDKNGIILCYSRTDYDKNLFYVFVDVKKWLDKSKPDFYILSDLDAKKTFSRIYSKSHKGKPLRKNKSDDFCIEYKNIKKYKDNNFRRFKNV